MKKIELQKVEHNCKIGDTCSYITPNITEDAIFYQDGKPIGFYISKLPERASKLADLANNEFRSKNVPKSMLNRASSISQQSAREDIKEKYKDKKGTEVSQMSVILGSIPPKPIVRRPYASISSVHSVKSAQIFIKSMIMLAKESEQIMADILPEQYNRQIELFKHIPEKWRFANLFTSSISNYNISAPYHRDTGNLEGTVNVIICKKFNSKGGDLNIPDFGATIGQEDNSMLVYPVWQNIHGVTPIIPTHEGGYRNSLVFYPLKAFKGLQ
jgi:hypothetical protein